MALKKQKNAVNKFKTLHKYKHYVFIISIAVLTNYLLSAPNTNLEYKFENCTEDSLHENVKNAIQRAKTKECKQKLIDSGCKQNWIYPTELQPTCDFYEKVKYLGCFEDSASAEKFLNEFKESYPKVNSPHECVETCLQNGFLLAGVKSGSWCHCGNEIPMKSKVEENNCDLICPGNFTQKCGGQSFMNVYEVKSHFYVNSNLSGNF